MNSGSLIVRLAMLGRGRRGMTRTHLFSAATGSRPLNAVACIETILKGLPSASHNVFNTSWYEKWKLHLRVLWNAAGVVDLDKIRLNGIVSIFMTIVNDVPKMMHQFMVHTCGIFTTHNLIERSCKR
jgi:hypothetical protein